MEHSPLVARYKHALGRQPRPARNAEPELAERARSHDQEAIDKLVCGNLAFVVHVAKEFRGRGVLFEDLLSEGCVGLLRAIRRFDPAAGTRFMTYASFWIRKAILQAIVDQPRTVRVPRYAREQGRVVPREVHLDAEVPGSSGLTLADRLGDHGRPAAPDRMIDRQERARLRGLLPTLSDRERSVLVWRFGLHGEPARTLGEVGALTGLSRERVRQIEVAALARLRKAMRTPLPSPSRRQACSVLRLELSQR